MAGAKVTGRKIKIENKDTGAPCPEIGGNNFFTGEFKGGNGTFGLTAIDQDEWEKMWETIGDEPPGRLPRNSIAVLQAVKESKGTEALAFEPSRIALAAAEMMNGDRKINIDWNRLHVDLSEDMRAHPRYAVLLLPNKGRLKASFNDIWPLREKREMEMAFTESLKLFKDGIITKPGKGTVSVTFNKYQARKMMMEAAQLPVKGGKKSSKGPHRHKKPRAKGRGSMKKMG